MNPFNISIKNDENSTFFQTSLFPPEIPEIQESTMQVPCDVHSIFDPDHSVPK